MKDNIVFVRRTLLLLLPLIILILLLHLLRSTVQEKANVTILGQNFEAVHWKGWIVYTNQGKPFGEKCARDMDAFVQAYYQVFGKLLNLSSLQDKIEIFIYATSEELQNARREGWRPDIVPAAGFYDPTSRQIAVSWQESYPSLKKVLYHEITHLLMDVAISSYHPQWSLWLNEGIAGCFENSLIQGDVARLGGVNPLDVLILRERILSQNHIPIRDLISGGYDEFRREGARYYYAESALLVYFLLYGQKGKYRSQFFQYFELELKPGKITWKDFQSIFEVEAVEKDFYTFLQNLLHF